MNPFQLFLTSCASAGHITGYRRPTLSEKIMSRFLAGFLTLTFLAGSTLPNKPNSSSVKKERPTKSQRKAKPPVDDEPIGC